MQLSDRKLLRLTLKAKDRNPRRSVPRMRQRRRIDPAADRPIYKQLADYLRSDIRAHRYKAGQLLPSERDLQDEYEVSLTSVRRALGILRSEGLVVTARGRGTRVRAPGDVAVVNVPPGATIRARPCTEVEARRYGLAEGAIVLVVEHGGETTLYAADSTELRTTDGEE